MSFVNDVFTLQYTRNLPGLDKYKYYAIDRSPLANYIMQPFWNSIVNILPLWMAPNLITLIGFLMILSSYLICYFYSPTMREEPPQWFYLYSALVVFAYQTLDALDGKQARRTLSSSPMGEIFDHSCDAMSTSLLALVTGTTLQLSSHLTLYSVLFTLSTFYVTQWEQYHRGVMEFWYFNVTEAQFIVMGTQIITYIYGRDFWLNTAFGFKYNEMIIVFGSVMMVCMIASLFQSISKEVRKKKVVFSTAITQLSMLVLVVVCSCIWGLYSPSNIMHNHPHFFFISIGFCVATYVGEIVVSRVCAQRILLIRFYGLPLIFLALNSFVFKINDVGFGFVFWLFSVVVYLHFIRTIVVNMCKYLKINFLTIPYPKHSQ